ncbi:heavy metal sensor histidine kinase [alpha proteobacterium U9-1i]|nr:heavy metal sensor histidine kinase [alpha proteobacterium U9-1i]
MSSVDAAIAPSPSSSAQVKHEPARRRRLDLIYFALAGFDLLTIGFTLMLSNYIMDLYQQSVTRSAVWSARIGELVELAQYAQTANAPGNDVFDSQNVTVERARRDAGLLLYGQQRDAVLQELAANVPGEGAALIADQIRAADASMHEMMREADNIFAEIDRGDDEAAGRRMATMDRVYARLTNSLMQAIVQVQQVEDANLRRQVALASQLRQLEFLVMGLIFFIVVGVAFYGRRIGQVMRATEDAHNAMLLELEAANEGLQQYADNVAHELRNPVNKMLVGSEVALSRLRSPEEYQEALVSNIEECQRLSSIVGSLLFLARARRTKVDLERQTIDVRTELELIRSYFEASAQEAGVRLWLSAPAGLALDTDRTLFQRAISNLVSNAISHTGAGGEIRMTADASEGAVSIEVADTGEGISEEAQARVFDRFYRVDEVRTATSGRMGLGLPIAKSIMDLHGGSIALVSQVGQGTSIVLTFPR